MSINHAFRSAKTEQSDPSLVGPNEWNSNHAITSLVSPQTAVSFSATPTFDASLGNSFKITLTGNVTSSTLANATAGQILVFEIIQDGSGGHSFVWPSNVLGGMSITGQAQGASETSVQAFYYDGANAIALGPGTVTP